MSENTSKTGNKSFLKGILKKCQKSFGINEEYEKKISKLKEMIEIAEEPEKTLLIENLETIKSNEKRRVIGTIR